MIYQIYQNLENINYEMEKLYKIYFDNFSV